MMHRRFGNLFVLFMTMITIGTPARAVTPDEMLRDPVLESRARTLSNGLRCVVCQNQSIDDSNAPLAHDLRVLLRDRLSAGDTDEQAVQYIVARYGNFVLLKPPFQLNTFFLWLGPLLILLATALGFAAYLRRYRASPDETAPAPALSESEAERLQHMLNEGGAR